MNLNTLEQFLLRHTHGLRIAILLGLLALIVLVSRSHADTPYAAATTIPTEAPLTVVLIESCERTPLQMFVTMPDGTILVYNRHSGDIDMGALNDWAMKAKHVVSARVPCGGRDT